MTSNSKKQLIENLLEQPLTSYTNLSKKTRNNILNI